MRNKTISILQLIFCILGFISFGVSAQKIKRFKFEADTTKKVNFIGIPIVIRTPETSWAFGASATATFKTTTRTDTLTRMSYVSLHGLYSLRNQNIQGLDATIYFPKKSTFFRLILLTVIFLIDFGELVKQPMMMTWKNTTTINLVFYPISKGK